MRPAYLAITGYLIGFLDQQRADLESRARELETAAERHTIARLLQDRHIQTLAGMLLSLESCRDSLTHEQVPHALADLTNLQTAVALEYDRIRAYIRSLTKSDAEVIEGGPPREFNV